MKPLKIKTDHAQVITNSILEMWDKCGDYERPWVRGVVNKATKDGKAITYTGLPTNAHTGKAYSGINVLILWGSGFPCRWFATYKQWSEHLGCQVRKGEKGSRILVWKPKLDPAGNIVVDADGDEVWYPLTYVVFNAAQVDGAKAEALLADDDMVEETIVSATMVRNDAVDRLVAATGAKIKHSGDRAYYRGGRSDSITMPQFARFDSAQSYYSVLFHELAHWTGAPKRLNRSTLVGASPALKVKAEEELVAELSACFTLAAMGLAATVREESIAYIKHWTQNMKEDKRFILRVASAAQKATNWILRTGEPEDDNDAE
jgi:antirestriction protein ArdC